MKRDELPIFPYHRDPIASGSIVEADRTCQCCGLPRGFLYKGSIYSKTRVEYLCPWCIADGSASAKFDAQFIDGYFCDDKATYVDLTSNYHQAVFGNTVGFSTFNPVGWWVHCGRPAEYITREEPYSMVFECKLCGKHHVILDLD